MSEVWGDMCSLKLDQPDKACRVSVQLGFGV